MAPAKAEIFLEPAPAGVTKNRTLEPAPAGVTKNRTQFCFWETNLIGILIMPSETFGQSFLTDMFAFQISHCFVRFSRLLDFIESKFDFSFEIRNF